MKGDKRNLTFEMMTNPNKVIYEKMADIEAEIQRLPERIATEIIRQYLLIENQSELAPCPREQEQR